MARCKTLLVSVCPLATLPICAQALWLWWQQGEWLWLGVLMVNAPILLLFVELMSRGPVHSERYLTPVTVCGWAGAAVTLLGTLSLGEPRSLAWASVGLGLAGLCVCLFWCRTRPGDSGNGLQPGRALPLLTLAQLDGSPVSTASLVGEPAMILFFRGNWCPLCMAQVRELAQRQPQLKRRGARTLVISAQPPQRTRRLARSLTPELEWWVDSDLELARSLGLLELGGTPPGLTLLGHPTDSVRPTMLITDARGEILYVDRCDDARRRPEPATFLRVLDRRTLALR